METYLRTKLLQVFSVGLCLGSIGCQQGFNLTKHPIDSAFVHSNYHIGIGESLPIVFGAITRKNDDSSLILTSTISSIFFETLQKTGINYAVTASANGNHININLLIDRQPKSITSVIVKFSKMILYFGSLSLLEPILPFTKDFDYKYTLDVTWPNKLNKIYYANCIVSTSLIIDISNIPASLSRQKTMYQEAEMLASKSCLNSLVNQMSDDYALMTKGYGDSKPISQPVIDHQSPTSPVIPTQPSAPTISKKKANVEPKQQIGELE